MEIVDQKPEQCAQQRSGKGAQSCFAPDGTDHCVEQCHRHSHAGGQTVNTVGNVDRVDTAHHNESGKDHVHDPRQHDLGLEERNVQIGAEHTHVTQQGGKGNGGRQLQQELLRCGQTGVFLLFQFGPIVHKADQSEHQGKYKDQQRRPVT